MRRLPSDVFSTYSPPSPYDDASDRKAILDELDELIKNHSPDIQTGITLGNVPFIALAKNPNKLVSDIVYKLTATPIPGTKNPLFADLSPIVRRNVALASEGAREKYVNPLHSKLAPVELVRAYLKDTPFLEILLAPIPYLVSDEARSEHWHVMAKTGHGKTQLLQNIMYQDISRQEPPVLIFIEPKGDTVDKISSLKIFENDFDRVAIISPQYQPAFNFLALPDRLKSYSTDTRRNITAGVIDQYSFALDSIETDTTSHQSTALANVVKLVLSMPNPDIRLLLDILDDDAKDLSDSRFADDITKCDEWVQRFFKTTFFKGTFRISRGSLSAKIQGLLTKGDAFSNMIGARTNSIDMFDRIQTPGSVTLVNTSAEGTSDDASKFFGKLMVAQVLSAILERQNTRAARHPTFLIVDEAGMYFDKSFPTILKRTRSTGLGILFAHQDLDDLRKADILSTALGQPSIRVAAPTREDTSTIADHMNTTTAFLNTLESVRGKHAEWAAFTANTSQAKAARITIPFGTVERADKMATARHRELIEHNRARFADKADPPPQPKEPPSPSPTLPADPPLLKTNGKRNLPDAD